MGFVPRRAGIAARQHDAERRARALQVRAERVTRSPQDHGFSQPGYGPALGVWKGVVRLPAYTRNRPTAGWGSLTYPVQIGTLEFAIWRPRFRVEGPLPAGGVSGRWAITPAGAVLLLSAPKPADTPAVAVSGVSYPYATADSPG